MWRAQSNNERPVVLIAGHDFKFLGFLMEALEKANYSVIYDRWRGHTVHKERKSLKFLSTADVIFCEWGLGNLEWYSKQKKPHQRLIVRVHSQELRTSFLKETVHENVDAYVFVNESVRESAIREHGVPAFKTSYLPNAVNCADLDLPKIAGAQWTIGYVGSVPQIKRPDIALDVVERLLVIDQRYRLIIKGKTYKDYKWMKSRDSEWNYYQEIDNRIKEINAHYPDAVSLESFSADMAEFYRRVSYVLSTSDLESFHYTVADGAASRAKPIVRNWYGADRIYPSSWIYDTTDAMVEAIAEPDGEDPETYRSYVCTRFDSALIAKKLMNVIFGGLT